METISTQLNDQQKPLSVKSGITPIDESNKKAIEIRDKVIDQMIRVQISDGRVYLGK